jgi:hypothetical protein
MPDDPLVTVARYDTRGEAELARARLDDVGIPCLLANAAQAGLTMMFDARRSGVQVRVPAEQVEAARSILGDAA